MSHRIRNEKDKCYEWYKNGKLHREDSPAIEYDDLSETWYYEGKKHRSDGPADISYFPNGDVEYWEWWIHGKLHREDGPAYVSPWWSGWYSNGKLHRENGPAFTEEHNYEEWYYKGKKHRIDGPAVITTRGYKEWHFHDIELEKSAVKKHEEFIKFRDKYEKALKLNNLLNLMLNGYLILDDDKYYKILKSNVFTKIKK